MYTCTVTREDSDVVKTYCGSTQDFKQRWYGHNSAERHQKNSNTTLSRYLWQHKLNDPPLTYNLKWKIIDRGRQFNPVTKICRLCSKEKFHILYNKEASSLNHRTEIFQPCPHKKKFILNNIKFEFFLLRLQFKFQSLILISHLQCLMSLLDETNL